MNAAATWLIRLVIVGLVGWPVYLLSRPAAEASIGFQDAAVAAGTSSATRSDATTRRLWVKDSNVYDMYLGNPSPDGRQFVTTDWIWCDLAIRDLETGDTRRLGLSNDQDCDDWGESSVYSPDGKQIAFKWYVDTSGGDELRVVDVTSSTPSVLVPPVENQEIFVEDWTPDGRSVAYVVARRGETPQLALATIGEPRPRILKTFSRWHDNSEIRMRVSPDGRYIAYSHPSFEDKARTDVHLLSLAEGRDVPLFQQVASDVVVGWADPTHLLFASGSRNGSPGIWSQQLVDGRATGEAELIRGELWNMHALRLTASGDVFYIVRTGDADLYTASIDLTTGSLGPLSLGITGSPGQPHGNPAWSPDGRQLAFTTIPAVVTDAQVVHVRALDGGQTRTFSPDVDYIQALTWMPDGQSLAARASDPLRGGDELLRIDLQSGAVTTLVRPFRGMPIFSPDGRTMYFIASDADPGTRRLPGTADSRLMARDLGTGQDRVVYTPPSGYLVCCSTATTTIGSVSPDGETVLITLTDTEAMGRRTHASMIEVRADGSGSREIVLPQASELPALRILGRVIGTDDVMAIRGGGGNGVPPSLWRVPLDGGSARMIASLRAEYSSIVMSPSGRHVALPRTTTSTTELWVLEDAVPGR